MCSSSKFEEVAVLTECMEYMIEVTKKAGELVKEGFLDRSKLIETKEVYYDVVTEYDRQTEDFLIGKIKAKYPDHKFIAEETTSLTKQENILTDEPTWIIDPIDGTSNFVHGIPMICISIALAYKKEIVIGIGYNPIVNELFSAVKGQGAFLNGQRIRVSSTRDVKQAIMSIEVSLASLDSVRDHIIGLTNAIVQKVSGVRAFGSAALTLCYVASGQIDAYQIEFLWPWDVAAGSILVKEAGGIIKDVSGADYDIMKPNVLAASTQELFDQLIAINKELKK